MENTVAPTGCYKCGRPGHWSRDCPVNPNTNHGDLSTNPKSHTFKNTAAAEKPKKKLPRSRPKLTPDLLLSDNGLGQILRHFPRAFKYRGRGHEVTDLGKLLGLYAEWHSQLLPYYPFDQFVHKVEQAGATKRVKKSIQELRERIASGVDPTKLHESRVQPDISSHEQDARETEEPSSIQEAIFVQNPDVETLQENMLDEVWDKAMEQSEPSQPTQEKIIDADVLSDGKEPPSNVHTNTTCTSNGIVMSEEQRARMEANRLKALERAAARAQSTHQT